MAHSINSVRTQKPNTMMVDNYFSKLNDVSMSVDLLHCLEMLTGTRKDILRHQWTCNALRGTCGLPEMDFRLDQ
jgi:hypothetical protein